MGHVEFDDLQMWMYLSERGVTACVVGLTTDDCLILRVYSPKLGYQFLTPYTRRTFPKNRFKIKTPTMEEATLVDSFMRGKIVDTDID